MTESSMTWERECAPQLWQASTNGDSALCVLWNDIEQVSQGLGKDVWVEHDRLAVVGNLRTPLGLSWFLQGLWHLSGINHVYVWGNDLGRTGQALFALWEQGLDSDGRVPITGWKLDESIIQGLDTLEMARRLVKLHDCRGLSLREVSEQMINMPRIRLFRAPKAFKPTPIPSRNILPSRRVGVRIEARGVTDGWLKAVKAVMDLGEVRTTRKDEQIAHFFHVAVTMPVKSEADETDECFMEGSPLDFSHADLRAYLKAFHSASRPEGVCYGYGQRAQNWRGHNQLEEVIDRLQDAPDTKRATIVFLESDDLGALEDAPCLTHTTYSLVNGVLHSSAVYRSHDLYEGWPYNILALTSLHRMIAEALRSDGHVADYGTLTVVSENAQVYERHWTRARDKIRQHLGIDRKPARVVYDDPAGNFRFDLIDEHGRTFVRALLTSPDGQDVLWHAIHESPERLIRWIVETFPQLRTDHVLYLGQEMHKLSEALAHRWEYVQG